MKKTVCILLALLLLVSCAFADEWIGGTGWWDNSYAGTVQFHQETGMNFRLPAGWIRTGYDSYSRMYEYASPDGLFTVSVFRRDDLGLYDLESEYSFMMDSYDMGMIILQEDRDWYIFADADHMTAYCEAAKGGLFGINLYFPRENSPEGRSHVTARQIISSVSD